MINMKKLLLALLVVAVMAVPAFAQTAQPLFVRVQSDIAFDNVTTYLGYINFLETNKAKIYNIETEDGFTPYIKVIGSWDTEFVNKPEYTILYVDIDGEVLTHVASELVITQTTVNAEQAYVDAVLVKMAARQVKIDAAQVELDAE